MREFDRAFVDSAAAALAAIPSDRKPEWGRMTPPQLHAHLLTAVRYSLGMEPESPNEGGWFGARVAAPLILGGWLRIPKNKKAPAMYDAAPPEAAAAEVAAALREFHARLGDPAFAPPPHPYFGGIGPGGWARLHQIHLDHHLRQFGAAPANFLRG